MRDFRKIDKSLFVIVLILCIFGLAMIFSASSASTILRYHVPSNYFFLRQAEFLIVALLVGIIILKIPTSRYKYLVYLATLGIIGLLILVLIKGKVSGNASSWFKFGAFTVQPSEFAKVILILFMATFYNELTVKNNQKLFMYFIPLGVAAVITFLVAIEPDYGSALIIMAMSGLIFLSVPMIQKNLLKVLKFIILGGVILGAIVVYSGANLLSSEQKSRFEFKNPCKRYTEDTGYQVCNGLIAISNGGLFGTGIGNSSQKYMYLPESHTDFIFPIIVEELGGIVGSVIILFYLFIILRLYGTAKKADNLRTSIIAYGAVWYFAAHILVNLLGVLALIPLTGVPLPFLSYGGSYTLCAVTTIFLVERVAIENKKNKFNREMKELL